MGISMDLCGSGKTAVCWIFQSLCVTGIFLGGVVSGVFIGGAVI